MRRALAVLVLLSLTLSMGACACSPGYVGRYGGLHPGRCVVY